MSNPLLKKLMIQMERIEEKMQVSNMIDESEAAKLLSVSPDTLRNMVYSGKLEGMFSKSPANGKRFYFKDKLIGL